MPTCGFTALSACRRRMLGCWIGRQPGGVMASTRTGVGASAVSPDTLERVIAGIDQGAGFDRVAAGRIGEHGRDRVVDLAAAFLDQPQIELTEPATLGG